ncbi:MAG: DUF2142 domain-containing protein [Lachnospiraceae bacterium]|nr:DUF2142 domain-containing protein [Lachnospiraceae bacterium]
MKRVVKKVWILIGMLLCFLVVPIISNVTRNSKTIKNNISNEPKLEYKASVSDVIEQEIYLEDSIESLTLYMSLEGGSTEPQYIENEDGVLELKNVAEFKVELLGLDEEEEQIMEFATSSPNTTVIIPIGKHNDKEKWVTVRLTVDKLEEDMELSFFFDSMTDSIQNASINGAEKEVGLSMKYVQKASLSTVENLFVIVAVLFLVLFLIWYMIQNKENKLNSALFSLFLIMEVLCYHFYDNYVYFQELPYIKKFYYLIVGMLFAIILGLFLLLKKKAKLEWVAAYCVFGFGLVYLLILPAFSAPDEPDHYVSAYKLSNQMLFQEPTDEHGNVLVRIGDYGDFEARPGRETYGKIYGSLFDFSNNDATLVAQGGADDAGGGIMGHLPGAMGITVARLLKLNKSMLLMLGRFMGLLFYCFCIFWAVKKMPFGKMVLFVISMFPMTLEESSSFGYDLVVNGFVFFITAYILNLIYEKQKVSVKDIVLVSLIMFLFAPCKAIYIFVAGLWILIPKEKLQLGKMKKGHCKLITTLIVFFSTLLPNILVNLVKVSGISSNSGLVSWAGERGYGMGDVLQNIPYSIYVFANTLIKNAEYYVNTLIGSRLGWLEITISQFIVTGFLMILLLEFFREKEQYVIKVKERVCYGVIAALISLAVVAAMWLAWTPISYDTIQGIQGRYFLPMIPLLYLMVANNKKIRIKSSINMNIILLCLLNVYAVLDVLKITFCR